jgi:hypothetical protein
MRDYNLFLSIFIQLIHPKICLKPVSLYTYTIVFFIFSFSTLMRPLSNTTAGETGQALFYDQHNRILYPTKIRRDIPVEWYQELFIKSSSDDTFSSEAFKRIRFLQHGKNMQCMISWGHNFTTNFSQPSGVDLTPYWLPWCTLSEINGKFIFYSDNKSLNVYRAKESPVPLSIALDTVQQHYGFRIKLADNKGWLFNQNWTLFYQAWLSFQQNIAQPQEIKKLTISNDGTITTLSNNDRPLAEITTKSKARVSKPETNELFDMLWM